MTSPRPWSISQDDNGDRVIVADEVMIVCSRPSLPDAQLIVRAVNSHDALVAAVKRRLAWTGSDVCDDPDKIDDALKAALKLAGEEI